MSPPEGWQENRSMFGSDVTFTSPIIAGSTPSTFIVLTVKKKVEHSKAGDFLLTDLKKQGFKKFKILASGEQSVGLKKGHFAEISFEEDNNSQLLLAILIPNGSVYHYLMFQDTVSTYKRLKPAVIKSLKSAVFN